MKKLNKKSMSIFLTAAIGASFVSVPAYAAETPMTIKAPVYYHVESEHVLDPVDLKTDAFALKSDYTVKGENGQFICPTDYVNNYVVYGPATGTFKGVVDIENGAGKDATFYGAVYDAEGRLVAVDLDNKDKAAASDRLTVTVNVGEDEIFKGFIWDGITLEPLAVESEAPVIDRFYCDGDKSVTIAWQDKGVGYTLYKNGIAVDASKFGAKLPYDTSDVNCTTFDLYNYTDTDAKSGDTYVVTDAKGISSEPLVADFTEGAHVTLDKVLKARNMKFLRNDEISWWFDGVSRHLVVDGVECESMHVKWYGNPPTRKYTKYFMSVDQSYLSGDGNTVDMTVKYYDEPGKTIQAEYFEGTTGKQIDVVETEGTNTWKTKTVRISNASFKATTSWKRNAQLVLKGGTIAEVSVVPYINTTVSNLNADHIYSNAAYLSWNIEGSNGITGYTIKRDGVVVAENVQHKAYLDTDLTAGTQYSYTVTAEIGDKLGEESEALAVTTKAVGSEYNDSFGWKVNSDGTGADGELILRRWYRPSEWSINDSYDRCIVFDGEDSTKDAVDGKHYSFNEAKTNGKTYQYWRNAWHFDIPDGYLFGDDYNKVKVEVEYYSANPNGATLNLFVNSDSSKYTAALTDGAWSTAEFIISKNDGKKSTFSNGWYSTDAGGYSDIKFITMGSANDGGTQVYIHKVTITKVGETVADAVVTSITEDNLYQDAVEFSWTTENDSAVTGYTIKRDGEVIAQHVTSKTYTDKDLDPSTEYSYVVIPEGGDVLGIPSDSLDIVTEDTDGPMLKTEVVFALNADGTATIGDLILNRWVGSYDRNIVYSGETGALGQVLGKYCSYNERFDYAAVGQASWKEWKNHWVFDIPDSFFSGTTGDYGCDLKIEVECYLPNGKLQFVSNGQTWSRTNQDTSKWITVSWTVSHTDATEKEMKFNSNADFEIYADGAQAYISKVKVSKIY